MSIVNVCKNTYESNEDLREVLTYCLQDTKCPDKLVGYYYLYPGDIDFICNQFNHVKQVYNQCYGKWFYHIVISFFDSAYIELREAWIIAQRIQLHLPVGYQAVYVLHQDRRCYHIHYIINSISYYDGERLNVNQDFIDRIKLFANDTENRTIKEKKERLRQEYLESERQERREQKRLQKEFAEEDRRKKLDRLKKVAQS